MTIRGSPGRGAVLSSWTVSRPDARARRWLGSGVELHPVVHHPLEVGIDLVRGDVRAGDGDRVGTDGRHPARHLELLGEPLLGRSGEGENQVTVVSRSAEHPCDLCRFAQCAGRRLVDDAFGDVTEELGSFGVRSKKAYASRSVTSTALFASI